MITSPITIFKGSNVLHGTVSLFKYFHVTISQFTNNIEDTIEGEIIHANQLIFLFVFMTKKINGSYELKKCYIVFRFLLGVHAVQISICFG